MAGGPITVVFFDLGDTLGVPMLSPPPPRLASFQLFPFVPSLLASLTSSGLRLGVISNTGSETGADVDRVLKPTGVLALLDANLRIYSGDVGITKADPAIFALAASRAGHAGALDRCLFVGEDARERATAKGAGMAVCPHPLLVSEVIAGQSLRFVRLTAPGDVTPDRWRQALRDRPIVPLSAAGATGNELHAITSQRVLAQLSNMGFGVDLMGEPDLPDTHELFILRDDAATASGFSADGQSQTLLGDPGRSRLIVSARNRELVIALPPDMDLGAVHLEHARHGHTVRLMPDPLLLPPSGDAFARTLRTAAVATGTPSFGPSLSAAEIATLTRLDAATMRDRVARFSGHEPLAGGAPQRVLSRHVSHADNEVASTALADELRSIGQGKLAVRLHKFTHRGRSLFNVEAELTGNSPELVLVTAHLDSTAAFSGTFNESTDPAPGADDDGSGVAAVLAIAEQLVALSSAARPARSIRFVLFNAEEEGLVGSKAYAKAQRAADATIAAVFQMDMIGYNPAAPRSWEIHAGFRQSAEVENRSIQLAQLMDRLSPIVSPLLDRPQIYRTNIPGGDPADDRSDHSSFQAHGYAACAATEDFFAGPSPDSPPAEENPNYHTPDDSLATPDAFDPLYAADIARVVAAAAWVAASTSSAFTGGGANGLQRAFSRAGAIQMSTKSRQLDTRKAKRAAAASQPNEGARSLGRPTVTNESMPVGAAESAATPPARTSALTGAPAHVTPAAGASQEALIDRALAFVRRDTESFGFEATDVAEFVPDPIVQRTSSGSAAVHLHQRYRGLPVFQMARTVRFNPQSQPVDATGDSASLPPGIDIVPKVDAAAAVLKAAQHLASTSEDARPDQYGETVAAATIDVSGFDPQVLAAFPGLAPRPTVFEKGPFENPIPAHLLIFKEVDSARLAWHMVLTMPGYSNQYVLIVAADGAEAEVLYCQSTMHSARARGKVFEFNPGVADRRFIDFPRPVSDYPVTPSAPLFGFPVDWVDTSSTLGNSTRATLNETTTTLNGTVSNGVVVFDPTDAAGDDQKLLNIFYFCNYMHNFLFILGFDEPSGNFQMRNRTLTGLAGDPVRARAHSGPVDGTANMATGPDGLPPLMNMGLVSNTGRHTAFDADVVFHEYVHGLTNRLAGGPLDTGSMRLLQPQGLGEGYSDYFALTLLNFFRTGPEKVVVGDWVVNRPGGIRRRPYDENYPFKYGDMSNFPEEHDMGEVWCAALMSMTRRVRAAIGNEEGYRISWQIVVDGLKLTSGNPTYLEARNNILRALDDLRSINRITAPAHAIVRKSAWQAFARFGMGVNAFSPDPDDVDNIVGDETLPPDLTT